MRPRAFKHTTINKEILQAAVRKAAIIAADTVLLQLKRGRETKELAEALRVRYYSLITIITHVTVSMRECVRMRERKR